LDQFNEPVIIQTGPGGLPSVTIGPDVASTATYVYWQLDDATQEASGGDLDIAVKLSAVDWTPGSNRTLVGQAGASGDRSFQFFLNSVGALSLVWYPDGIT